MKVLQINSVCGIRSTGRVCTDVAEILSSEGHDCKIAYGRATVPEKYEKHAVKIGDNKDVFFHCAKSRLTDNTGFGSKKATYKFIDWVKEYDPDIIHLHNIHGYYINIEVLFDYLRNCGKTIFWSLYDCWSFTGHCAHYDYNGCNNWLSGCESCAHKKEYPKAFFSNSLRNYQNKKRLFSGIPNLHIIAPSNWMKNQVEKSFLKEYPIHICPNGIDLDNFKFVENKTREKYNLEGKKILLGVSSYWNDLKGLFVFKSLLQEFNKEDTQIILVGKGNKKDIPQGVLHIDGTDSINTLCELYSAADVFVNPTLQETQGLTSIEALACGTPVVVFNSGGAAEAVDDTCGIVVERGDIASMVSAIKTILKNENFTKEDCINKSLDYDKGKCYSKYIDLYKNSINRS